MLRQMRATTRLCWLLLPAMALLTLGCAHTRQPHFPTDLQHPLSRAGGANGSTAVAGMHLGSLTASELDSLYGDAERLLDSLAVPVDPFYTEGPPDISDSLAAITQAQMPSVQELFDYPVVVNHRVLSWIDFYEVRAHDFFNRSLQRSGRYLAMARRIFAEEGVPTDLAFLPHVESGFRYNARSRVRAVGLWQFMRGTAKLYGLRCDAYVDERLDPEKSTRAAARLLRDLYALYQDWYLALAAYNAGAGNVNRAVERCGSHDFWKIDRERHIFAETRNFVPAMLAATILAKSPGAYGFVEETDPPLEYDVITLSTPTDLRTVARCAGTTLETIQELNPAVIGSQTPPERGFAIHVPKGTVEQFAREFAKVPVEQRVASATTTRHKVKRGETLGMLAQRYKTTVKAIQSANKMGRSTKIRVGQSLRIPGRRTTSAPDATPIETPLADAVRHTVRRGECLAGIARKYGIKPQELQAANHIKDPSRIAVGQVLVLPSRGEPVPAEPRLAEGSAAEAAEPLVARVEPAEAKTEQATVQSEGGLRALNTSDALGRVPTTRHIVEQARLQIQQEQALAAATAVEDGKHRVTAGETLSDIARRYGVKVADLRRWNRIGRNDTLEPGEELLVSGPPARASSSSKGGKDLASSSKHRFHVVRRGETLYRIAKRYGVKVSDLISLNHLSRAAIIHPGQKLRIQ